MVLEAGQLEVILQRFQRDRSVQRVLDVSVEPAVTKGENYTSQMLRVKMKVVLGSGHITTKSLIVKRLLDSPILRDLFRSVNPFHMEIYLYSQVFPAMERLMSEGNDRGNYLWCQCIGYKESEEVLMEDLKEDGFKMTNRRDGIDLDHGLLAVRSLARFHAMSCILQKNRVMNFESMAPYCLTTNTPILTNYLNAGLKTLFHVMRNNWENKWSSVADRLEFITKDFGGKLHDLGNYGGKMFKVLNHGDCWTNNILFKYDSSQGMPLELRFVDFQVCSYNSFAWDLVYFFQTSFIPEYRRKIYDDLLAAYMNCLGKTLEHYEWPKEDIPSMDHLKGEIERLKLFGLLLTCTHLPATISNPEDAMDLEKMCLKSSDDHIDNLNMYLNPRYTEIMKNELQYLIDCGDL